MQVKQTKLSGVMLIEPDVFTDERGFFVETFQQERYAAAGLDLPFVQDNFSRSKQGVLRGLHFQALRPQGKLVRVSCGKIWDVAVDIERGSPTFGQWVGVELSEEDQRQLYVPPGYAHGFVSLSPVADVHYRCTDYYVPGDACSILWCDEELGIDWPVTDPILSAADAAAPTLAAYESAQARR